MNIDGWISCISEAYEITGGTVSPRIKEILLRELPEDDLNLDEATRAGLEAGVFAKGIVLEDESLNDVIEETRELVTRHFFKKFVLRETFGPLRKVEERFETSLEGNYQVSGCPFIDMAKVYWTYKLELGELFPKYHSLVLSQILLQVERDIGSVFFPTPGPSILWVRQRRERQRQLIEKYAPQIDIDAFLENNPILGTSKGRIAQTVFDEKIWIRCPNSNCSRFLRIPNTIKPLEVTCPKCKTSLRFPAMELNWLNHLPTNFHPTPYKIEELENLRESWSIPDEVFAIRIVGSEWATRQIQEYLYAKFRQEMPASSEKDLLRAVFNSRALPPDPVGLGMSEEESVEAMKSINSLDDLVNYFIAREQQEPALPDPFEIGVRIDEILSR